MLSPILSTVFFVFYIFKQSSTTSRTNLEILGISKQTSKPWMCSNQRIGEFWICFIRMIHLLQPDDSSSSARRFAQWSRLLAKSTSQTTSMCWYLKDLLNERILWEVTHVTACGFKLDVLVQSSTTQMTARSLAKLQICTIMWMAIDCTLGQPHSADDGNALSGQIGCNRKPP